MPIINVPQHFKCAITQEIMKDPVMTTDGQTYERSAIEEWFADHDTSPSTNIALTSKQLVSNIFAKQAIQDFLETNKACTFEKFISLIIEGDYESLTKTNFLEHYVESLDLKGYKPLSVAAIAGYINIAQLLIDAGADVNGKDNAGDHKGNVPLIWSACQNQVTFIEFLVEQGANVNATDNAEWTALHWAVNNNQLEAATALINAKINLNSITQDGNTALHLAAKNGFQPIVKLLLEQDACHQILNKAQQTPMITAELAGKKDIGDFIINHYQALSKQRIKEMAQLKVTLAEQEQLIKKLQAENQSLQQRNHQLEQRMAQALAALRLEDSTPEKNEEIKSTPSFFKP